MNARVDSELHQKRLKRWGESPDRFEIEMFFLEALKRHRIDPKQVISELAERRRAEGRYAFASRKLLTTSATRHIPLTTIPPEFPPVILHIGKTKDSFVAIDRMLPSSNYDLQYFSNKETSFYFLNRQILPETVQNGFIGQKVERVIGDSRDERIITRVCLHTIAGIKGTGFHVDRRYLRITSEAYEPLTMQPWNGSLEDAEGRTAMLGEVVDMDSGQAGNKTWTRPDMHAAATIIGQESAGKKYLLLLPVDKARHPKLAAKGAGWDRILECYVIPFSKMDLQEISAIFKKCETVHCQSPELLRRLR